MKSKDFNTGRECVRKKDIWKNFKQEAKKRGIMLSFAMEQALNDWIKK